MFTNEFSSEIKSKSQIKGQEFKFVSVLKEVHVEQPVKPARSISSVCCYWAIPMASCCFNLHEKKGLFLLATIILEKKKTIDL